LETVTVTGLEVNRRPSTSRATAVKVCDPLLVVAVSQETAYGAPVSSPPRLTPSSLNWTPMTRIPAALRLAWTAIPPLTVEPEVGEETVTTRLPPGRGGSIGGSIGGRSCAKAGLGAIQATLRITAIAAA
jgi:hypothetical protein